MHFYTFVISNPILIMPEIKYKAFNSYIDKLIRAFNSRTAPIAIWSDSLFRYKEVEQEIESNIVFLTPEQCRNYIGGLIRQVEKNINTIHDNSEAVKQFLQAGNYSEEAMDEARMSAKIVPDAFIDDIPTNAQLKYEGYTDDDITNGRMLQQYYVRKRLGWLKAELETNYLTSAEIITPTIAPTKHKSSGVSFIYDNPKNNDAIPDMLASLKKNNFIDDNTSIKEFRKIFNNELPSSPIVWTGKKSELYYFIHYLLTKLNVIAAPQNKWQVVVEIFVDGNGQKFDAENLKGLKKPSTSNLLEIAANFLM